MRIPSVNASPWTETRIPERMDRLPWTRWHWLVVTALGVTWILDGLEVTLAGALGGVLTHPEALALSPVQIGASASAYLIGAVVGALGFGWATDRFGRKKLFFLTVGVYLTATAATAFSWDFWSYIIFRALTGAGIGGEYAAINSAIDELIPARLQGRVNLAINATFWIGAAIGSSATLVLLHPDFLPVWLGWRMAFGIGALLGLVILFFRRWVPESPRWLMVHGRADEAEQIVAGVERHAVAHHGELAPLRERAIRVYARKGTAFREIWHAVAHEHRSRSILGLALMIAQAFFFNGVFFTYPLVLVRYFGVSELTVGGYLLPFALANAVGPMVLGRFFDTWGRKPMIVATYAGSGLLLVGSSILFLMHALSSTGQTAAWMLIFFVASAAASSAYLTVSEIFPLEIRGLAIAIFFAVGTFVGGVAAPLLYGWLIGVSGGDRWPLFLGYLLAAGLMISAALVEAWLGVKAERKSLECIATPLSTREESA